MLDILLTTVCRRSLRPLAAVFLLAVLAGCAATDAAHTFHLVLLHTSDVHGQCQPRRATWLDRENPPEVGGLPRVAAFVNSVRAEVAGPGQGVLVVDAGDWFQGTPESYIEQGGGFLRAMSLVGYDVMCVGNHDLDLGVPHLREMIARYRLPAVLANVRDRDSGGRLDWVEPFRIVDVNGFRVAVIGVLSPETPIISHQDATDLLIFDDPAQCLGDRRAELAGAVDFVLPVSHCGIEADVEIVRAAPGFPVLLGGHSHSYLPQGQREGGTLIIHSGAKASAVGRADLWFDRESGELVDLRYELVDLLEEPPTTFRNPDVDRIVGGLIAEAEDRLAAVVGALAVPLERAEDRLHSSTAGNLVTDVMREVTGAAVAIQNRGGLRCDLEAGPVTRRHIFEFLPFDNDLVVLEVTGAELHECVRRAVEEAEHEGVEFSGMLAEVRPGADRGTGELLAIRVAGETVDPAARYEVVTNSFLARGGDGYFPKSSRRVVRENPVLLREMLETWFESQGPVTPDAANRYRPAAGRLRPLLQQDEAAP